MFLHQRAHGVQHPPVFARIAQGCSILLHQRLVGRRGVQRSAEQCERRHHALRIAHQLRLEFQRARIGSIELHRTACRAQRLMMQAQAIAHPPDIDPQASTLAPFGHHQVVSGDGRSVVLLRLLQPGQGAEAACASRFGELRIAQPAARIGQIALQQFALADQRCDILAQCAFLQRTLARQLGSNPVLTRQRFRGLRQGSLARRSRQRHSKSRRAQQQSGKKAFRPKGHTALADRTRSGG